MVLICNYVAPLIEAAVKITEEILLEKRAKKSRSKRIEQSDIANRSLSDFLTNPDGILTSSSDGASSTGAVIGSSVYCDNCRLNHVSDTVTCTCICHGPVQNKLLIFSTGVETYTPHLVAFKLIRASEVLARLNVEVMPDERRAAVLDRLK